MTGLELSRAQSRCWDDGHLYAAQPWASHWAPEPKLWQTGCRLSLVLGAFRAPHWVRYNQRAQGSHSPSPRAPPKGAQLRPSGQGGCGWGECVLTPQRAEGARGGEQGGESTITDLAGLLSCPGVLGAGPPRLPGAMLAA